MRFPRPIRLLGLDVSVADHPDIGIDFAALKEAMASASPQWLSLGIQESHTETFWELCTPALPRLRYMELLVSDGELNTCTLSKWLVSSQHSGLQPRIIPADRTVAQDSIAGSSPSSLLALVVTVQRPPPETHAYPPALAQSAQAGLGDNLGL